MPQNPARHAGSTPLVACVAPGVGTVAQSIVLVTIAKGLGAFLLVWSEKPANA